MRLDQNGIPKELKIPENQEERSILYAHAEKEVGFLRR